MPERTSLDDRTHIFLTGDQVKLIRSILGESQEKFARRFAVAQPVIYRLEKRGAEATNGPLVILIDQVAKEYAITVPDQPIRRPPADTASA